MYKFLLYEPIHQVGLDVLEEVGTVTMADATDEDSILRQIGDVDGVVIRSRGAMTRRIMENAPRLRVVGRHGVGVDNVDLVAATDLGVQVVNTPQATVEGVAEHALGLLLALAKRIAVADKAIRQGDFEIRYRLQGFELRGRTLGVVGFGRIGRRVAQICHFGLGMRILYYDVRPAPDMERLLGAERKALMDLLAEADCVTVHVPLLPQTEGLIGEAEFAAMCPDALFINTSRGAVVDEEALHRALQQKEIAGAGLDVFAQEPTPVDNPLFELPNVVLTPHIATATEEALQQMALVATDVVRVLEGQAPVYPVNRLPD